MSEQKIIDLEKLREEDKKNKAPHLTKDDLKIIEEQKKNGQYMDTIMRHEHMLRKNKEVFNNNDSLLLYRLPLSETQREQIYNQLIKSN